MRLNMQFMQYATYPQFGFFVRQYPTEQNNYYAEVQYYAYSPYGYFSVFGISNDKKVGTTDAIAIINDAYAEAMKNSMAYSQRHTEWMTGSNGLVSNNPTAQTTEQTNEQLTEQPA